MRNKLSRIFLAISLFSFGFIVALVLLSDFEWTGKSEAADSAPITNMSKSDSDIQPGDMGSLQNFNKAFIQIANKATPSVVTIQTEKVIKHPNVPNSFGDLFGDDFMKRFFPQGGIHSTVLGSGVIVSDDGYILTNNHVVAQGEDITVTLADGRNFKATDVKTDPQTDLAVVKIDAKDLPAIQLGNSDELQVGEWVVAIGSPFGEKLQHTVTAGIISAKGRTNVMANNNYQDFIQTDAAINPGNSGGALVNLYGQLVGINTAIATNSGGYQGIGFAIPINMATKVMNDLIEKGHVVRAWLGVRIQDVDSDIAKSMGMDTPYGALIASIETGSPASKSDLKVGDVIVELDGNKVKSSGDLRNKVASSEPGSKHKLTVMRKGDEKSLSVTLGELPDNLAANASEPNAESNSYFGMALSDISQSEIDQYNLKVKQGVLITAVDRNSEAAKKGIRPGDVITRVGVNHTVDNLSDFQDVMSKYKPGDSILLMIQSGDNTFFSGFTIPEDNN